MDYLVEELRVRYGAKTVRNADAATFELLLAPWARDRTAVYFAGRKVSRARAESFHALGATLGCDAKRIFYSQETGHVDSVAYSKKTGLDPRRARAVEEEGQRFLVAERVWIVEPLLSPLELDVSTFEVLGRGYVRDHECVLWFGPPGFATRLEDADPATFTVDATGARDRKGRFLADRRDDSLLPVQCEDDPERAAGLLIEGLWKESLESLFAQFDRSVLTDYGLSEVAPTPEHPTPIPAHRLRVEGPRLILEADQRVYTGTVSGIELLAGWLFGVASQKTLGHEVCIRVGLRTDGAIVSTDGAPPRWQRCVDLAYLFEKLGCRQEASFLLQRVQRWRVSRGGTTADDNASLRIEKLLGFLRSKLPNEVIAQGSTTQSATTWLVEHQHHLSTDALVRRDVASSLGELATATTSDPVRLARIAAPLLVLLGDPEPAVRAEAAASFDLLCSKVFHRQAYDEALSYASALATKNFNLDLQSARRWECLAALGREQEAEAAWSTCAQLTRHDRERATSTWPRTYSSFDAWRAMGRFRLRSPRT